MICEMEFITNHLPAVRMHLQNPAKSDETLKYDGFNNFMKFPFMLKTSDAISKCLEIIY